MTRMPHKDRRRILQLEARKQRLQKEALNVFRPLPYQEQIFRSTASELLVRGGNRCLHGDQIVYDPVLGIGRKVREINEEHRVWSVDPESGERRVSRATKPYIKGVEELFDYRLATGQALQASASHLVLAFVHAASAFRWVSIDSAYRLRLPVCLPPTSSDSSLGAFPRDDVHLFETASGCPSYVFPSIQGADPQILARDDAFGIRSSWLLCSPTSGFRQGDQQSSSSGPPRCCTFITSATPLGQGEVWDFEVPGYGNYVAGGLVNHNSGKSVCSAILFASAALNHPVIDSKGEKIPLYESHKQAHIIERPLTMWVIGLGEKHIGQTLYRLLFKPGLFDIIFNKETKQWEAFDPERHAWREGEVRPAPPAIPSRMIDPKGWGWKDKSKRLFEVCRLVNGTEIYAFTSVADPKMGDPVDYIWIDEKIRFDTHYDEWQARISDRRGRIVWSVWPGNSPNKVMDLIERAEKEESKVYPDVEEVRLTFSQNPFIDDDEKRKRLSGWSDDVRKSRDEGELVFGSTLVFPTFSQAIHGLPGRNSDEDAADRILKLASTCRQTIGVVA